MLLQLEAWGDHHTQWREGRSGQGPLVHRNSWLADVECGGQLSARGHLVAPLWTLMCELQLDCCPTALNKPLVPRPSSQTAQLCT